MAELTPKQRTRGLKFANAIAFLASKAPDDISKRAIFGAVKIIREHHGFSGQEKRDIIARSLRLGCTTYSDLEAETKFHRAVIIDIVKEMAERDMVELRTLGSGEKGGRPMVYIYLSPAEK